MPSRFRGRDDANTREFSVCQGLAVDTGEGLEADTMMLAPSVYRGQKPLRVTKRLWIEATGDPGAAILVGPTNGTIFATWGTGVGPLEDGGLSSPGECWSTTDFLP